MSDLRETENDERRARLIRLTKLGILTVAILALVAVALMLAGVGGEHGPSRHSPPAQDIAPSSGHSPPPGMHE